MEKILKLYTYVDGVNDTPFPSEKHQVVTSDFRSDYKRMGAVPTISCTIMHPLCLDKLWTDNVYAEFKGEKFFIKQTATSSYNNTDSRYKHEVELVSERIILDNVYVFDVVTNDVDNDKPVSNSTKFTFFGTIHEFAERLNYSLQYSKLDYRVIVDEGVTSEGKLITFENQFFSNALQESYNTYEIPYYFVGKDIHIGFTNNAITKTFKYGVNESLLSIQKSNANAKIVNRITGVGSADNIPYYYPNNDEKGETRLLYNGEAGSVSINNVARYKKVELGDVFSYKVDEGGTTPLWVLDEYNLSEPYYWGQEVDDFGEVIDGVYLYNVNFSYSFPIDIYKYVIFEVKTYPVGYPYDMELKEFNVQLSEDTRGLMGTYYKSFSENLGQGNYVLQVHAVMRLSYKPEEILLSDFKEIINIGFFINATYEKETVKSWYLDGAKVTLDSYGITTTNTPKDGDKITFEQVSYLMPQENLMPTIYRESEGEERFYNALNETYISPQTNDYYQFENPYVDGKPKEHFINFEEIKPTIVGITNAGSQRIDMFSEFAYDENDNDEMDEEGNYIHPYFFGKLRRFDGDYGFNLFEHAIDEGEMTISMTSGNCGGCEWVIGVDEDTQKNIVQVNEYGNLLRDDNGNVKRNGSPQERQNDTSKYEVWVALKKDINTFGVIMPNATNNYRPNAGDTFVILHIDLPKAYILAAEKKLEEELIKYMAINNSEKFNFSISFSRIFFAENPDILEQLNENARIQIEYDNTLYELYVSSYSYNMSNDTPLPEIKVELSDTLTVSQNAIQNAVDSVKHDIMSSVGSIDFLKQGLRYFIRKDVDDRAKGKVSTDKAFEVGEYVSGSSGAIIYKDPITGQTIGEMDKLYVRMKAYFETLEIINAQSIGGKQIISPVGSVACVGVEELDDAYRCYFLAEQDGEVVQNRWKVNDQAYSQMFNANIGVTNKVSNHYYWRLVTNVSDSLVEYNEKKCHYIDLSKTDMDKNSDVPKVGDIINQRGSRTDIDRMNFVETSSIDAFSPSVTLYHGVNSFSLAGKDYVQFGVDKTTNKAFMNVYGDMYVGDRNKTAYMRYTQEEGLVICGKLDVGTKLGDSYLKDLISASTPEGYQEFVEKVTQDLEGLQAQIDGTIDSYFFQYEPSLDNYPASDWDTEDEKKAHLNDTFTNLVDGRSWRWSLDGTYKWVEITDTATTKALALAGKAQDTADGKRRVFVDTPYPPYDKGDLWSRGSDYPLLICVVPKESGVYAEGDFDYADNNVKLKEEMQTLVADTKSELNNSIGQAKEAANKYADEGIASAKEDINASIAELEKAKANVTEVYSKAEADGKITEAETNAINAAKAQADAAIALSETTIKAYADGIVDDEEAARIKQAQENLAEAKKYAEEQAQAAREEIENSYLFQALQDAQSTEIENGLVLTSLIQLRDTQSNIMSGINGLINASKGDKSIATWWGGDMLDLIDYYTWDGTQWAVKSGITAPSNIPSGLIRMDGTGYLAKGKFWWDNDGKIYADPTALFLSFDVENEGASLSATILDIRDKQTEFANMWSLETDSNGTQYLYSKYPLVSQGGVTMYAGTGGLDVEGIYDGLPIDGSTIYWENGVLKAQGGGGGVADSVAWANITGKPTFAAVATSGSYNDLLNKPTLLSSFTNDVGYLTEHQDLSGYQPLITSSNKLAYSLISGTPTIPTSLKSPYALTFGSKTYDGSAAKTITASDLGALTAHQTIYNLTMQAGAFSAVTFDPNGAAKTVNIPTTTSHISEGTNLYFTNARAVSALSSTLSGYLPLTGGTLTGDLGLAYNSSHNSSKGIRFDTDSTTLLYLYRKGSDLYFDGGGGYNKVLRSDNYSSYALPLTGGTLTGNVYFGTDNTGSNSTGVATRLPSHIYRNVYDTSGNVYDHYYNTNYTATTYTYANLRVKNASTCRVLRFGGDGLFKWGDYNVYHSGNLTKLSQLTNDSGFITSSASISGNAATATKLATARTIWGQSFDGSGNISDNLILPNYYAIQSRETGGTLRNLLYLSNSNVVSVGNPSNAMRLYGLVGIETSSPSYNLHVNGSLNATTIYQNGSTLDSLLGAKLNSSSYTAADVLAKLKTVDGSGSGLDADTLDGYDSSFLLRHLENTDFNDALGSCVLPISTTSSPIASGQRYGAVLQWSNTTWGKPSATDINSNWYYQLWGDTNINNLYFRKRTNGGTWSTAKALAFITDNVASATKLQTPRTIWGQSFDGTGNVDGSLYINNNNYIHIKDTGGTSRALLGLNSNNDFLIGIGSSTAGYNTHIYGNNIYLRYGTSNAYGIMLNSSGNVGIGTTSPTAKLHIVSSLTGSDALNSDILINGTGSYSTWHRVFTYNNSNLTAGAAPNIYLGALESKYNGGYIGFKYVGKDSSSNYVTIGLYAADNLVSILGNGNVGIGTTSPNSKIEIATPTYEYALSIKRSHDTYGAGVSFYNNKGKLGVFGIDGSLPAFCFDNGSDTRLMIIKTDTGRVGIGTTSPSYKLHVEGSVYSSSYVKTSSYVQVGNSYYNNSTIELYGSTPFIDFHYNNSTADYTTRLIEGLSGQLTCTGKFRIGLGYTTSTDYNFYVSGSAYISSNLLTGGGITMYSARVLKNVVDERGLSLRELSVIKPTRYTWKDKRDERLHIGGIADDIQQVLPEVVYRTPDGVLTMDYGNAAFAIASSLIKPMIEHESEIVSLKRRVHELEEEVKRLRA